VAAKESGSGRLAAEEAPKISSALLSSLEE
jgi:hypothetical protein